MTPTQTKFCNALAEGKDAVAAYREAYPAAFDMHVETVQRKAASLASSPAIIAAVAKLQGEPDEDDTANGEPEPMTGEEAAAILAHTARRLHRERGRPADIVRCLALLARLCHWTEYQAAPDELDPEDPEDITAQIRREMGLDE